MAEPANKALEVAQEITAPTQKRDKGEVTLAEVAPESREQRFASILSRFSTGEKRQDVNEDISKPARYALHGIAEAVSIPGVFGAIPGLIGAVWDRATDPEVSTWQEAFTDPHYRYLVGELIKAENDGDMERADQLRRVMPADLSSIMRDGLRFGMDWYDIGTEVASKFNEDFERIPGEVPYDEEAAGIILSAGVGIPAAVSRVGTKTATTGARKAFEKIASSKPVRVATRTAEILTPVTLPLTKKNVAMNAAAGVVINDVIRGLNAESSATKLLRGGMDEEQQAVSQAPQMIDGVPVAAMGVSGEPSKPAMVALGIGAIAAGAYALSGKFRSQNLFNRVIKAGEMHGQGGPESVPDASAVRGAAAARVTQGEGLTSTLRTRVGEDTAEAFADTLATTTRSGGDAGVRHAADTGELPGSGIVTVPFGDWVNRLSTLTPDQQNVFAEGAYATAVKRDRQVFRLRGKHRYVAEDWTGADVQQRIAAMQADPAVMKQFDDMQKIYADLAEYRYRMGDIDRATYQQWQRDWGGAYIPLNQADEGIVMPRSIGRQMLDDFTSMMPESIRSRIPKDAARGEIGANVFDARLDRVLDNYFTHHIKRVQMNNARRDFVDLAGYTDTINNRVRPDVRGGDETARRIHRVPSDYAQRRGWNSSRDVRPEGNVIRVTRNGKDEFYDFGDGFLARELEFQPHAQIKFFNAARRLWQQGTTGILQPARAPLASMWDTIIGGLSKNTNRAAGYIDELVLRATGGKMNAGIFDPTGFLWNVQGAAQGIHAQGVRELQRFVQQGLLDGSSWLSEFALSQIGRAKLEQWSQGLMQRFMNTTYYQMHAHGFSNTSWLADPGAIGEKLMSSELMRQMPTGHPLHTAYHRHIAGPAADVIRVYQILMDSVHNGFKYAYVSRNLSVLESVAGRPPTTKEIQRVVREARQIAGDMTRHVDLGDFGNKAVSSVPYANVAVQSMAHIGRQATRSPRHFAHFVASMGSLTAAFIGGRMVVESMGGADWYHNELPGWQRSTTMIVPSPDAYMAWLENPETYEFNSDDMVMVPLPPELMPFILGGDYMFEEVLATEAAHKNISRDYSGDLGETLVNMLGFATPPGIQIPISLAQGAFGADPVRLDLANVLREADVAAAARTSEAARTAGIEGDTVHGSAYVSDNIHDILSSTLGVTGRIAGQMAEAALTELHTDDASAASVFDAMWDEGRQQYSKRVVGSSLWTGYNTKHLRSSRSDAVHDRIEALEGMMRQATIERGGARGQVGTPTDILMNPDAQMVPRVNDPVAQTMVGMTYQSFSRSPLVRHAMQRVNAIRTEYNAVQGNHKLTPHDRQLQLNELVQEIQGHYETLAQHGEQFESTMKKRFGDQWSIEWMVDYVRDAVQIK